MLTVSGTIREAVCEVLYEADSEFTLAHLVLQSLVKVSWENKIIFHGHFNQPERVHLLC